MLAVTKAARGRILKFHCARGVSRCHSATESVQSRRRAPTLMTSAYADTTCTEELASFEQVDPSSTSVSQRWQEGQELRTRFERLGSQTFGMPPPVGAAYVEGGVGVGLRQAPTPPTRWWRRRRWRRP